MSLPGLSRLELSPLLGDTNPPAGSDKMETYLIVIIVGKVRAHLLIDQLPSFVSPSSSNVAHGITTASKNESGEIEALDELDTVGMASHGQVKTTKTISGERIASTLENDCFRTVIVHDSLDDRFEDALVSHIGNSITKREIDRIILTRTNTNITEFTSTREVFAVFVERDGHDAIGGVKSLFDSIAMMNIDINVENALLKSEELEDAEDDV
jgi:hypothetical protein